MSETLYTLPTLSGSVGHWRFKGDLRDQSARGNNFTSSIGIDSSNFSSGYAESGITAITVLTPDALARPAVDSTAFDFGTSDFTLEVILNVTNGVGDNRLIQKRVDTAIEPGWMVSMADTGKFRIEISGSLGGGTFALDSISAIDDASWHYCAAVINRTSDIMQVYIDGVQSGSDYSIAGILGNVSNPVQDLYIQHQTSGILIDEICITTRALTSTEIAVRAAGHGDPEIFDYSGSATELSNTLSSTLNAFDVRLKHPCNHVLTAGQFELAECPRCLGTGYFYDIKFDTSGRPTLLVVEDKLAQALEKMVLTSENKFHTDVYVDIKSRLGELQIDVAPIIKYDLQQAIASLRHNQRSATNLSSRAQIARLNSIDVVKENATTLRYIVTVTTVSGEKRELSGTVYISS